MPSRRATSSYAGESAREAVGALEGDSKCHNDDSRERFSGTLSRYELRSEKSDVKEERRRLGGIRRNGRISQEAEPSRLLRDLRKRRSKCRSERLSRAERRRNR